MQRTAWCRGLMLAAICLAVTSSTVRADDTVLLWPNGAPGKVGDEDADKPWLWVYPAPADKANGTAVVVCPGGGYGAHAVDHEGTQVARWFNSIGVTVFVLKYRLGQRYQHPAPMQDVQRAIQYVRANAEQYGVKSNRIGVMGFSAGGHLASTCATHFLAGDSQSDDPVSRVSSRPDFAVLCYPVITMTEPWGHGGSKRNLLGANPDPEVAKSLSNDLMVTEQTPPTFIFHTTEDTAVPVENAIAFFSACRKHKVPVEMHVYQFGPHGVGLAPGDPALSTWKDRLHDWLRNSGLLADVQRAAISGMISLEGTPLKWGQVAFYPENGHAPVAMAMVRNGAFKLDAAHGPVIGLNRVTIVHMGDVSPGPTVKDAVTVPSTTPLTFQVAAGTNQMEISLK